MDEDNVSIGTAKTVADVIEEHLADRAIPDAKGLGVECARLLLLIGVIVTEGEIHRRFATEGIR